MTKKMLFLRSTMALSAALPLRMTNIDTPDSVVLSVVVGMLVVECSLLFVVVVGVGTMPSARYSRK